MRTGRRARLWLAVALLPLAGCPSLGSEGLCANGVDDDDDGLPDCDDSDCFFDAVCSELSFCGDGVLTGAEVCEDGNVTPGDGCRADCLGGEECGDRLFDPAVGEICDDGNQEDGDACAAGCQQITGTQFFSALDINGQQPEDAVRAVFGEADIDADGDGALDSRAILLIASDFGDPPDDAALCAEITQRGLAGFLNELFLGNVDHETVLVDAFTRADTTPFAPGVIRGDFGAFFVDGGFVVIDDGQFLVSTSSDFLGVLSIEEIGATLRGHYDGLQIENAATPGLILSVPLQGGFIAADCPAVSNDMPFVFTF
jgi:cysteine-rich repeat protein